LLIDPDAAQRRENQPAVAEFAVPEAPPPAPPPQPQSSEPTPPAQARELSAPKPVPEQRAAESSVSGVWAIGVVPASTGGVELQAMAQPTTRWGWGVTGLYLSPGESVETAVAFSAGLTAVGVFASFRPLPSLNGFVLEAGPWLGALQADILPAGAGDASVSQSSTGDLLFAAVSAGAGLEAYVSTAVFLVFRGRLLAPLVRHELTVSVEGRTDSVSEVLWTQPALAGAFSAGVGLAFF
jgi:hypothetical protein